MTGAKNGTAVAEHVGRDEPGHEDGDADLEDERPPVAQPAQPALEAGAEPREGHGAAVRRTRSAPSHGLDA